MFVSEMVVVRYIGDVQGMNIYESIFGDARLLARS